MGLVLPTEEDASQSTHPENTVQLGGISILNFHKTWSCLNQTKIIDRYVVLILIKNTIILLCTQIINPRADEAASKV
jgi:hypothetical protein